MSICTFAARELGRITRPTTPAGAITAMSGFSPSDEPLSMVIVRNSGLGAGRDDLGGRRLQLRPLTQIEQLPQAVAPLRLRALLLQLHLQRLQLAPQGFVLGVHVAKRDVARPQPAHAVEPVHRPALQLGEDAEGRHLNERNPGRRRHLR